jgi:hypothetical protein
MGVARGLARHHAQAEALAGIIGRRFQPPVVEQERFALAAFDEQLPVVGPPQRVPQDFARPFGGHAGGIQDRGGGGVGVHERFALTDLGSEIGARGPIVTPNRASAPILAPSGPHPTFAERGVRSGASHRPKAAGRDGNQAGMRRGVTPAGDGRQTRP